MLHREDKTTKRTFMQDIMLKIELLYPFRFNLEDKYKKFFFAFTFNVMFRPFISAFLFSV